MPNYTDKQKAAYWKKKARGGSGRSRSPRKYKRKESAVTTKFSEDDITEVIRGYQQFLDFQLGEPNRTKLNERILAWEGEKAPTASRKQSANERLGFRLAKAMCECRMLGLLSVGDELAVISHCMEERDEYLDGIQEAGDAAELSKIEDALDLLMGGEADGGDAGGGDDGGDPTVLDTAVETVIPIVSAVVEGLLDKTAED